MTAMYTQLLALLAVSQASARVLIRGRRWTAREVAARSQECARPDPVAVARIDPWRSCRAISRAALVVPWRVRCLPAALALHQLLRWQRASAAIQLGVRQDGSELMAHAWVECGGYRLDPMNESEAYEELLDNGVLHGVQPSGSGGCA